jgi:hypothetical protein
MTDTPPEIKLMVRAKLMALSGEERMIMGAESSEAARTMVIASLPKDLPEAEFRRRLFERIYGEPAPF